MSNQNAKIIFVGQSKYDASFWQSAPSATVPPIQKQWAALRAAVELVGRKSESFITAHLYDEVRTFFMQNE